jgi:hypothetical protein
VNQTFDGHAEPDIGTIWEWFEFQAELIASEQSRIRLMLFGPIAEPDSLLRHERCFMYLTQGEVEAFFDDQRGELELLTMFELLAITEAVLRIDFATRRKLRLKDPLSRRFQAIRRERIRLDEDILEGLRQEVSPPSVVSDFRAALKLRNWLAHGRHWHPKLGRGYRPADVFDISKRLLDALSG